MHSLSVALGPVVWRLVFNTAEKAEAACAEIAKRNEGFVEVGVTDDYGQTIHVNVGNVTGLMLEDLDRSKLAYVAMALHQTRSQMEAQKAARNDPALRAASLQQGPAVIAPGGFQN